MPESNPPIIQLPSAPITPKEDPVVIFTMPEAYRHGAVVPAHIPESPKKELIPPPSPIIKPPVPPALKKPLPAGGKKKPLINPWMLIAGGFFVVALAIAGGILYLNRPVPVTDSTKVSPLNTTPPLDTTPSITVTPDTDGTGTDDGGVPPDVFPTEVIPGQDADSDGLTNVEERLIYGTDLTLPDTDRDGFLDGNEVFHGYSPNGLSPSTLSETSIVQVYVWQKGGLNILAPNTWEIKEEEGEESSVYFGATTGEIFRISKVSESFDTLVGQKTEEQYTMTTKQGYRALITQNQQTVFFEIGTQVYTLTYDVGIKGTLDYLQTFYMMLNSFILCDCL